MIFEIRTKSIFFIYCLMQARLSNCIINIEDFPCYHYQLQDQGRMSRSIDPPYASERSGRSLDSTGRLALELWL